MTVRVLIGDVFDRLRELPADSFDCVVTSPPYWGLRDYGVAGQLGLEPTLGEHLDVMVRVFAEVHRVLKPTGTLWLNYGDCYATSPNGRSAAETKAAGNDDRTFRDKPFSTIGPIGKRLTAGVARDDVDVGGWGASDDSVRWRGGGVLKAKDLCMIPNRLAIALQEWGWWVRSEIVWAKPNPMPESIKDRPATSHEKVFLLSKSSRYFYEADDVRVEAIGDAEPRGRSTFGRHTLGAAIPEGQRRAKERGHARPHQGFNEKWDGLSKVEQQANGRSLRNWEPAPLHAWVIGTAPFSEAHFATFPPELVERCLLAGCPKGGSVLDPFGGAGTTALVADQMQLDATIIELNPDYVHIAVNRIEQDRGALQNALDPLQLFEPAA